MATTYAALASLLNTISMEQPPRYHPHRQISIDDGGLIQALQKSVNSWLKILEAGWNLGAEHLEDRLADAAYAAEDVIESYVVDQVLHAGDTSSGEYGSAKLCQDLEKIIKEMDSIAVEVKAVILEKQHGIKDECGGSSESVVASSTCAPPQGEKSKMVGFEDERKKLIDQLTWGNSGRKVIPIVGMGGSGKTTLARNIYHDQNIMQYFDFCAWVTVSQEYIVKEIFIQILKGSGNEEMLRMQSDESLGEEVYKRLFGRRYLIVLDDIWTIDAWNEIEKFFPNDHNESRIMITTREFLLFAIDTNTSFIMMNALDVDNSWNLLCENVFDPNSTCPPELQSIGKEISKNCGGLPLSIIVIAGLLVKSKDRILWEHIAKLSSSAIQLDEEQRCLKILSLSYNHLPVFLKPCFLYMGVFPEDYAISVSELVNLWIAEGFLTSVTGKSLEEVAKIYLLHLIGSNLITVRSLDSRGEIKYCGIHDALRELCIREAQKEKFLCVVMPHTLHDLPCMDHVRRIAILLNKSNTEEYSHIIVQLLSISRPRSFIVNNYKELPSILGSPIFQLLRVFFVIGGDYNTMDATDYAYLSKILFNLVNLRYLACDAVSEFMDTLVASIGFFGNLQTLVVHGHIGYKVSYKILNLPQLRHVASTMISLFEPPFGEQEQHSFIGLKNLQTIKTLLNFKFEEDILEKISNVKKLVIWFTGHDDWSHYSFHNLDRLEKLESFKCMFLPAPNCNDLLQVFPHSLKKLSLRRCSLLWENMTVIGSLPLLEVLKLGNDSFIGPVWHPKEGEFLCLKFLCMRSLNLKHWNAEKTNFPCLEHLLLNDLHELNEIPSDIGDIATLRFIELDYCSDSLVSSAKDILEEQQDFGNEGLRVNVALGMHNKLSCNDLENKNIHVTTMGIPRERSQTFEVGPGVTYLDLGNGLCFRAEVSLGDSS